MIKKVIRFLNKIIGLPYYFVLNLVKGLWIGGKSSIKGVFISIKWSWRKFVRFVKYIPTLIKMFFIWLVKALKESIAQIFTLLGFFIAWLTLTGSAKDIVGIAILISTALWLLTIGLREDG